MDRKKLAVLAVVMTLVIGGGGVASGLAVAEQNGDKQQQGGEEVQEPLVANKTHNDLLEDVGDTVPGFGGLYRGEDKTIVYVYIMDPSQQEAAERAAKMILGDRPISEVRTVSSDFTMTQLAAWYRVMRREVLGPVDGVQSSAISEGKNRITLGLITSGAQDAVEAKLAELGIPREAVDIEVTGPIEPLGGGARR